MRALALTVLLLGGCALFQPPECQCRDSVRIVRVTPPAELLEPIDCPLAPDTITALSAAGFIVDLRKACATSAAQVEAINEYYRH